LKIEQQLELDRISDELFYYVNEVWVIKDLSDNINKNFGIASPYLNFRDALFHYKKMYIAAQNDNDHAFIQQQACIEEHLNRGLKDFAIHLMANCYIVFLHELINSKNINSGTIDLRRLRHIYHEMKNIVAEIRIEGQILQHFDTNNTVWLPSVVDVIREFDNLLGESPFLKQRYTNFIKNISK